MNFTHEKQLSKEASDLIQFDADSIRQVVTSRHGSNPDVWLANPDAYESNGRLLRDTESPRLLAYSKTDQVLYATDGCNTCTRRVDLKALSPAELEEFAVDNELQFDFLRDFVSLW